jgi:hypothetical protein
MDLIEKELKIKKKQLDRKYNVFLNKPLEQMQLHLIAIKRLKMFPS